MGLLIWAFWLVLWVVMGGWVFELQWVAAFLGGWDVYGLMAEFLGG